MSTLAVMKARIASELARSNLTTQIADAINDAIAVYQKQRFRFSDIDPVAPPTFNTVVDQAYYSAADNANISTMFSFDYVFALIGNMTQYLVYQTPETIKLYNQTTNLRGQPGWYSYEGDKLLIAPVPDKVYLMTLGIFRRIAAPATDGEVGNKWMTDGERLIRARAKYEIAVHVTRNPVMAQAMSPDPPAENGGMVGAAWREWKSLKGEANKVTGSGKIRSMPF